MTESKIIKLQESLVKSESKVSKIESTIEKGIARIAKTVSSSSLKEFSLDFSEVKFGLLNKDFDKQYQIVELDNLSMQLGQSNHEQWDTVSSLFFKLRDINNSHFKLVEALQVVSNWEAKLAKEVKLSIQSEQTPQSIIDFLDAWEVKAFQWHMENDENAVESQVRDFLAREKQVKLLNLTSRVEAITGTIIDAKGLKVSPKGDLTGVIVGTQGNAHVQSILAGGWNIQCYHLRTLVHKL